jgi:hypothetical protein
LHDIVGCPTISARDDLGINQDQSGYGAALIGCEEILEKAGSVRLGLRQLQELAINPHLAVDRLPMAEEIVHAPPHETCGDGLPCWQQREKVGTSRPATSSHVI